MSRNNGGELLCDINIFSFRRICMEILGEGMSDPCATNPCLALSEEHILILDSLSRDFTGGFADKESVLARAAQWFNELFHLASRASCSEGEKVGTLLSPRLICPAVAWEWLVAGVHPATASAASISTTKQSSWVVRSSHASFGQLLGLVAHHEQIEASLRIELRTTEEQAVTHLGEARALRTRLAELESLLRGSAHRNEREQGAVGDNGGGVTSDLAAENQVSMCLDESIDFNSHSKQYCVPGFDGGT